MPPSVDTPDEIATVIVAVIVALGTIVGGIAAAVALGVAWWRAHIGPLLKGTAADAARARAEVSANHGSSMRDAVTRVEATVAGLAVDVRDLRVELRDERVSGDATHSEIFRRLRGLESPEPKDRP